MQFGKFEEKAMEFIEENSLFVPCEEITQSIDSRFMVKVVSLYKDKSLEFSLFGLNCFTFNVRSTNLDELFEKALKVLKAYGPKGIRERNKGEVETTSEGEQE